VVGKDMWSRVMGAGEYRQEIGAGPRAPAPVVPALLA
jgi:hypothetical protein